MNIKQNYLSVVLSLLLVSFSVNGLSQITSVSYELIYKPDPAEKNKTVKNYYKLDVLNGESIFRTESRRESDSLITATGLGLGYNTNPNYELYLTKELHNNIKKSFVLPISRDKFFIKIKDELNWKILAETMVINNLSCQKAQVEYGGRKWTAWFAKNITLFEGPYYFHGLPGLIIQIQDDDEDFNFTATEIKNISHNSLFKIDHGKEITWKQYERLMRTFFDSPYAAVRIQGKKVYTDSGSGGYQEIDYNTRTKQTQAMLLKNNNLIELNHKIEYK